MKYIVNECPLTCFDGSISELQAIRRRTTSSTGCSLQLAAQYKPEIVKSIYDDDDDDGGGGDDHCYDVASLPIFAQIQPVIMDKMEKYNNMLVVSTLFYTCQPYNLVISFLLIMTPCAPILSIHIIQDNHLTPAYQYVGTA